MVAGQFEIYITDDILFEYEEILEKYYGSKIAKSILQLIENAPNVHWINNYYKWNLIKVDSDDNKFVDCAISCGAKFLVSNDKHFDILKKIKFPKVEVVTAAKFLHLIK